MAKRSRMSRQASRSWPVRYARRSIGRPASKAAGRQARSWPWSLARVGRSATWRRRCFRPAAPARRKTFARWRVCAPGLGGAATDAVLATNSAWRTAVVTAKASPPIVKLDNQKAVVSALTCLRLFDIDFPARPSWEHVHAEYETVWQTLDGRPIESDLPLAASIRWVRIGAGAALI